MAHVVLEIWSTVADSERAAYMDRARERQAALQGLGVSYWIFERSDAPGEMVQYLEARDSARLEEARALVSQLPGEREILLHQLEL
ncbi:MAG: hypothetical protein IPF98_17345 [Gemmatimonadetes bacterium]|nr:hypothetical protein [Gemmatimonadota bacterium]